jgi:predicted acyltransferase (DUF342 family)
MAQIIKHRRGSIDSLSVTTAKKGELVIATGSINDFNGPWIFVGETEGSAGAFRAISKIYQGTEAPNLTSNNWGSTLNGTPFYSSVSESLQILSNAGNTVMDLTGNLEGNSINSITISTISGNTSVIGNVNVTNNLSVTGTTSISGATTIDDTLRVTGNSSLEGNLSVTGTTSISGATTIDDTLRVTGNSSLEGNLNVTGDTTFNDSVTITGLTDNRLVLVGTNGLLEDSADLVFDGTKLQVGQGQFEVDVNTGEIRTSGSITMKGNITIGDNQGGDIIDFNGEVSSSIIPSGSNLFDLGSPTNAWKDLYVSGTAYIENINIGEVSLTNLALPGNLTVSGTTTLSGSVLVEDLTEKRLVVVGVDGLLTDYSGLTFDNGNLNLSGALEVTNIQGTGSLYLKPDLNDSRLFEIYNTTGVTGTDIHFKGNADYNFFGDDTNYLKIDNTISKISIESSGGVDINTSGSFNLYTYDANDIYMSSSSDITLEADTDVTITAGDDLRMYSNDVFSLRNYSLDENITLVTKYNSGDEKTMSFDFNGNLTIPGGFTGSYADINTQAQLASAAVEDLTENRIVLVGVGGELEDDSNFTFDGTTFKIGDGDFEVDVNDGDIRTSGSLSIGNGMTVNGNHTVNGVLTVTGATDLKSTLVVSGATTIDDTLLVTSNSSLEGTLSVTGHTTLFSGLTVNGNETVNGVLTVTGNTQLGGNLYVSGNLEVLGSATNVNIQSLTVEIGDNIILVNAYSPFQRYAGLTAYDSGSAGTSGSLLYDSLNDYWVFQNSNALTSKIVGVSGTTMGSEASLTANRIPVALNANTIKDSLLGDDNTTLTYNTNKFTVQSSDGATLIAGNVTLSSGGGADATNKTSAIVFKNSSNVLGYVSTTETTDVLDGILGYKNSNGALTFSTVIDGGTYA